MIYTIIGILVSLLCCGGFVLVFLAIVGFVLLRRRGKTNATTKEAVSVAAEEMSRAFVRTGKSREQLLREEEEEDRRPRR